MGRFSAGVAARSRPSRRICPASGKIEAGDHAQDGGLAAARRPQQREELAAFHGETDVLHRLEVAKAARDVANFEQCHDSRSHLSGPCRYLFQYDQQRG
jgi:hypothetical protein